MKEIEEFLRENKPQVKEDPSFILRAQRRMEQVDGIKAEVDRQQCHSRLALIIALAAGTVVGVVATVIAFLYPLDAASASEGLIQSIRAFLQNYRLYLLPSVALLAIGLGLTLARKTSSQ